MDTTGPPVTAWRQFVKRSRRTHFFAFIALTLACLGPAPVVRAESSTPKPTLTIGYLPITDHLTIIAKERKTFTQSELKPVKFGSWPELAEALKAGAVDGAFVLSPIAINLRQKGAPLRAVLLGHRNGSVITVRADGDIHTPADLKGRTVAIPSRFSTHNILLHRLLEKFNLDPDKDLKIIELTPPRNGECPGHEANRCLHRRRAIRRPGRAAEGGTRADPFQGHLA
jgi:NitT/TauT family transport system substrate-binding protein